MFLVFDSHHFYHSNYNNYNNYSEKMDTLLVSSMGLFYIYLYINIYKIDP